MLSGSETKRAVVMQLSLPSTSWLDDSDALKRRHVMWIDAQRRDAADRLTAGSRPLFCRR
jgi:hypothetical protein